MLFALLCAASPIELWHSYHGAEAQALDHIAHLEADRLGVQVTLTEVPYDNFQNKLLQALAAGQGPDLFIAPHERLADWQRYLSRVPATGDLSPALLALHWHGENVGLAFAVKTLALVTQRSLVKQPIETLEDLKAIYPLAMGLLVMAFWQWALGLRSWPRRDELLLRGAVFFRA